MLSYRHQFHAGNFADVFKHALLAQLVLALEKKDKPFLYLDTHAGIGRYDLAHEWSQKNAEHKSGIELIWSRTDAPPEVAPYLDVVRKENPDGLLRVYPGSPIIARRFLSAADRMLLSELNPKDHAALAAAFTGQRRVTVQLVDGYRALKAFLPPPERRALIFIDSSFDRGQEFERLAKALVAAHKKFATGVYALWYPLMDAVTMNAFERRVAASGIRKILQLEIVVRPRDWTLGVRGCGMLVVNPPFGFEGVAKAILKWLTPVLSLEPANGTHRVKWLVPE